VKKAPLLGVAASLLAVASAYALPSGMPRNARIGCGCHGSNLPTTQACIDGLPIDGQYTSGRPYPLVVSVSHVLIPEHTGPYPYRAGFSLEVGANPDFNGCTLPSGAGTGTLVADDSTLVNALVSFEGCAQATHTIDGAALESWTMTWQAPTTGNPVYVFLSGNAVNGDNQPDGDVWSQLSEPIALVPRALEVGGEVLGRHCSPVPIPLPAH
jgi:hypothetical protein